MNRIKILFGKRIKELRLRKKMTQSDLAELVGVEPKHISCIERGKNFPSPDVIEKLAQAFQLEPKNLFEYYYLQDKIDLKSDIINMVEDLDNPELSLTHSYIRNFIITRN